MPGPLLLKPGKIMGQKKTLKKNQKSVEMPYIPDNLKNKFAFKRHCCLAGTSGEPWDLGSSPAQRRL